MAKILMPEGSENINIGEPIAIVVENKEDIPAFASATKESIDGDAAPAPAPPTSAAPAAPAPAPAAPATSAPAAQPTQPTQPAAPATPATPAAPAPTQSGDRVFISPLAKTILKNSKASLDLHALKGSGPQGRVLAADVLAALAGSAPAPTATAACPGAAYEDKPVSAMRKVISTRLTESKQTIPHYYLNQTCYIDELLKVGPPRWLHRSCAPASTTTSSRAPPSRTTRRRSSQSPRRSRSTTSS